MVAGFLYVCFWLEDFLQIAFPALLPVLDGALAAFFSRCHHHVLATIFHLRNPHVLSSRVGASVTAGSHIEHSGPDD